MCYRAGPLLSPKVFRDALVPEYRRITDLLKSHGTDVVLVDCDGDMRALLPHWLEAGVNTMFPIEIGTWGTDPVALRQQFGRRLLMVGGVSKRTLAGSKDDIDAEVSRLAPLVEEGGFIPTPDHRVPPDVPLENYLYYLERARSVWGKGLPNLPPMGERSEASPNPERYAWHLE
jgi:uroporphyrinogen decarboxylase